MISLLIKALPVLLLLSAPCLADNPGPQLDQELGFQLVDVVPAIAARSPKKSTSRSIQPRTTTTASTKTSTSPPVASSPAKFIATQGDPSTSNLVLVQDFRNENFLQGWDFFNYPDPTHGQVNYLNKSDAIKQNLVYNTASGTTILKVDNLNTLPNGAKRNSVRITSKQKVKPNSLVILDAAKLPYGPTVWPAFWTVGDNWPHGGEIDIVEGVHEQPYNHATLHTTPGCKLRTPMLATGRVLATNCDTSVNYNEGCGVEMNTTTSYGAGFNAVGGGVYAMYWNSGAIRVWNWPRARIPADIKNGVPKPWTWGKPAARWGNGTCSMGKFFSPQTMVFDITLCGDWAGNVWSQSGYKGNCSAAVANPRNYDNAYFEINSVQVYELQ